MTIVTAADKSHEKSLLNFLASVRSQEKNTPVIVYDLGLSGPVRERIEAEFDYEIREFQFDLYPSYFNIEKNAGEYAWKPTIVKEVADERGGLICWMDAGNIIHLPLLRLRWLARKNGFFSRGSKGTIGDWTHPGMLEYLGLPPGWKRNAPNLNASGIAFHCDNRGARELLDRWAHYSLVKDCIAPAGSSRQNHRQDQALLTVLAYQMGDVAIGRYLFPEFLSHQDVD